MKYKIVNGGYLADKNGEYTLEEVKKIVNSYKNLDLNVTKHVVTIEDKLDKIAKSYGFKDISDAILWANNNDKNNTKRGPIAKKLRAYATLVWNGVLDINDEFDAGSIDVNEIDDRITNIEEQNEPETVEVSDEINSLYMKVGINIYEATNRM